jgi:hypothetical protein
VDKIISLQLSWRLINEGGVRIYKAKHRRLKFEYSSDQGIQEDVVGIDVLRISNPSGCRDELRITHNGHVWYMVHLHPKSYQKLMEHIDAQRENEKKKNDLEQHKLFKEWLNG